MKNSSNWGAEVFEEASNGMLILDQDRTILAVNGAFRGLLGYDAAE